VTFESPTQPTPAAPAATETTAFAPDAINATVLPEIVIAVSALIDSSESRMTTRAFEMLMGLVKELPVTTNSWTFDFSVPLQVSVWVDSATGACAMSQSSIE
jgi:hypothetical protein